MSKSLAEAMAAIPAPPCEAYSCALRSKCGEELLACSSFMYYIAWGRRVNPHLEIDRMNIKDLTDCKWLDAPQPTRELYMRAMKDETYVNDQAARNRPKRAVANAPRSAEGVQLHEPEPEVRPTKTGRVHRIR